jgi:hypothetical protein
VCNALIKYHVYIIIPPDIKKIMEDSNLWGENIEEDFMNSIEETDPLFLEKLETCVLVKTKFCRL